MEVLKQCKCGTVATNEEELKLFEKNKGCLLGYTNKCKVCKAKYHQYNKEHFNKIRLKTYNDKSSEEKALIAKKQVDRQLELHGKEGVALKVKSIQLKHKYGITLEDLEKMLDSQNGECFICAQILTSEYACIDHNHDSGEIRGALCQHCNSILGMAKDSVIILQNAINYLEQNGSYGDQDTPN